MTEQIDILGRPPIMKPVILEERQPEPDTQDWRGEHLITRVPKARRSGFNMKSRDAVAPVASKLIARRSKVSALFDTGLSPTEIGAQIGCTSTTVRKDLIAMGLR